jgi:hypothetical protein
MQPENAREKNIELQIDPDNWLCRSSKSCGNASVRNLSMRWILTQRNW